MYIGKNFNMNYFLKLRYYSYTLKRLFGNEFKSNKYIWDFNPVMPQCAQLYLLESRFLTSHSYCQVREFAKRAQGKLLKGGKTKTLQLTDEEMASVIDIEDYHEQLHLVVENLKKEYIDHLSHHSVAGNIQNILVKMGDEEYPLNELAIISKKNPNLIAINMVEFPEALKAAIQAIVNSGSDMNPQQDGTMIYLTIPKLTREHRENLVKSAKSMFVKAKNEVRIIQNSFVKAAKSKTELSEDLVFNATNQIMAIAGKCVADLEKVMKAKEKELLGSS